VGGGEQEKCEINEITRLDHCSQPSGGPAWRRGGTAKSLGRQGIAEDNRGRLMRAGDGGGRTSDIS